MPNLNKTNTGVQMEEIKSEFNQHLRSLNSLHKNSAPNVDANEILNNTFIFASSFSNRPTHK